LVCSAIEVISFTTSPIRSGFRQFVDALVGGGGLLDRVGRNAVGFLDAAGDFADRIGEFVRCDGRGTDVLGCGLGGAGRLPGKAGGGPRRLGELPGDDPPGIVWFHDDLRLSNHLALHAAARTGGPVICLYVLDEESRALKGARPLGGAARWWLVQSLRA
jgi:hypothetical protein